MFATPRQYTIRPATALDDAELRRLAILDSQPSLAGEVLLAEMDGRIVAAVAMDGGRSVADPFVPTAALVAALRTTRFNHMRRGAMPSLRDRIVATLRPASLAGASH
jgi:6-phosphofructokinase